jgi:hypothetical protein
MEVLTGNKKQGIYEEEFGIRQDSINRLVLVHIPLFKEENMLAVSDRGLGVQVQTGFNWP